MTKIKRHGNLVRMDDVTESFADLTKLARELPALIDDLKREIDGVVSRMASLKNAGLIYATEFWRRNADGIPKYFYLLYPQELGKPRRREYVGCDPQRIAQARAGIARAREYENAGFVLQGLNHRVYSVKRAMEEVFLLLSQHK